MPWQNSGSGGLDPLDDLGLGPGDVDMAALLGGGEDGVLADSMLGGIEGLLGPGAGGGRADKRRKGQ